MTDTKAKLIDARGSFCPGPLMELIRAIKEAQVGETLELLSSDKGTAQDVPEWVAKVGHEMVGSEEKDGVWHLLVRKAK
jgi:tRNA 2-thiouridine synthesizing protein A